jgi:hypothetical protein
MLDHFEEFAILIHADEIAGRRAGHERTVFGDTIACVAELDDAKRFAQAMRLI